MECFTAPLPLPPPPPFPYIKIHKSWASKSNLDLQLWNYISGTNCPLPHKSCLRWLEAESENRWGRRPCWNLCSRRSTKNAACDRGAVKWRCLAPDALVKSDSGLKNCRTQQDSLGCKSADSQWMWLHCWNTIQVLRPYKQRTVSIKVSDHKQGVFVFLTKGTQGFCSFIIQKNAFHGIQHVPWHRL